MPGQRCGVATCGQTDRSSAPINYVLDKDPKYLRVWNIVSSVSNSNVFTLDLVLKNPSSEKRIFKIISYKQNEYNYEDLNISKNNR